MKTHISPLHRRIAPVVLLFLALSLSASSAWAQVAAPTVATVDPSEQKLPRPSDLKIVCLAGPQTLDSSPTCPVIQQNGYTYWAYSFVDNGFGMAIVAYDDEGNLVKRWDREGARYLWKITVTPDDETVTFVGQGSRKITMTWAELLEGLPDDTEPGYGPLPPKGSSTTPPTAVDLHLLARQGDAEQIAEALENGRDPDERDASGRTALLVAAGAEERAVVEELLFGGADPNIGDFQGNRPLIEAVKRGDIDMTETLLNGGADASEANVAGESTVHLAIARDDPDLLQLLLDHGADPNATYSAQPEAPLDYALARNKTASARTLIEGGADVSGEALATAITQRDPQMVGMMLKAPNLTVDAGAVEAAVKSQDVGLVKAVLDRSSSAGVISEAAVGEAVTGGDPMMVALLLARGGDADTAVAAAARANNTDLFGMILNSYPDASVTNALFDEAVTNRRYPVAEMMLGSGIDVNEAMETILTQDAGTLIPTALARGADGGPVLVYAVNKNDAALVDDLLTTYGGDATRALVMASAQNNLLIVQVALRYRADAGAAMAQAAGDGFQTIVQELLTARADPNLGMQAAAAAGNAAIVSMLLQAHADPEPGMAAAVEKDHANVVSLLLSAGADGTVPAYMEQASTHGNAALVAHLLQAGASPDEGMAQATMHNHTEVVRVLLDAGADPTPEIYIQAAGGHDNVAMLTLLVERGAHPQAALASSVQNKAAKSVAYLIGQGVDVSNPALIGVAVRQRDVAVATALLDAGAVVTTQFPDGWRLIHRAVGNEDLAMTRLLLSRGADPNARREPDGETPMHLAGRQKNIPMLEVLYAAGGNVNAVNERCELVYEATPSPAIGRGDTRNWLRKKGAITAKDIKKKGSALGITCVPH